MNRQKAADMYDAKADRAGDMAGSERDGTLQILFRDKSIAYRERAYRLRDAGKGGRR